MNSAGKIAPAPVLELARRGFHVLPVQPGKKTPAKKGEADGPKWGATNGTAELADLFGHPELNLGISCGPSNLVVLDLDVKGDANGMAWLDEKIARHGALPNTIEAKTPSGGRHIYFAAPGFEVRNTAGKIAPGVDIRADGGYVVAPPSVIHADGLSTTYEWKNPPGLFEAAPLPDWLVDLLRPPLPLSQLAAPSRPDFGNSIIFGDEKASPAEVEDILGHINPDIGYQDWCNVLMGLHAHFQGSEQGLSIAEAWSARSAKYKTGEVAAKWKGFSPGGGVSFGTVCELARQNGADLSAITRKHRVPTAPDWTPKEVQSYVPSGDKGEEPDWQSELVLNSRGRPVWNTANVYTIISNDADLSGCFAFDEFRQMVLVTKELPGSRGRPSDDFAGRYMRDDDVIKMVVWFNKNGFPNATKNIVGDVIGMVSQDATFHPVRNYLMDLPEWDGVERVGGWLEDYCRAVSETEEGTTYLKEVGKRWLISAVARTMKPGCKADAVLILEGRQGSRKSTALKVLCGEDWFGDSLPSLHTKDANDYVRGKWMIEMAELSNINKAEVEVAKAFISRSEERFRPAYARSEVMYPRQCVFAGSTNKTDYLRDETGNRRFWPVAIGGVIDTDGLKRDRDQIWAEALKMFLDGELWWLDEKTESIARTQQEDRVSQDAWEGEIARWVEHMNEVSAMEIATALDCLNIEKGKVGRAETNRITSILATLGFTPHGKFTSGQNKDRRKYVRKNGNE